VTPQKPEETGKGETRIVEVENGQSPPQPAAERSAQAPAKAEEEKTNAEEAKQKAEETKSEARKAIQTDSGRLPNTGNRSAQLAALAGMGLLGLVASLVAKLKKKED
jgi:LPXTG-motif cell wall anchor domain protein